MNQSLVFKTEKVTERITRIYAFSTELMYLVEGTERAALIEDVIQVCEDIKAGRTDDVPFEFAGTTGLVAKTVDPSGRKRGNIVYSKDRV